MSYDMLVIVWFGLWGLIWTIYFTLDAYTLGTGMLFPFITKNVRHEKQLIDAVGPFWGGNEVWLVTAGGATFAAFPLVYALMFSYLYTPFMLILFAIFFRAIGLEFMHKHESPRWQAFWKWAFFTGSVGIAFLFGVTFANLFRGLPIGPDGYEGTLFTLLNSYGWLGGFVFVALFLLSGAAWIGFKTRGEVHERALNTANVLWYMSAALLPLFFIATSNRTSLFEHFVETPALWIIPSISLAAILASKVFLAKRRPLGAFAAVSLAIIGLMATGFVGMFPNMLSAQDPAYSITLYEGAGSELNLTIMFIVAVIMVPFVAGYQIFAQRVFREKITPDNATGYE